jgi:hypothetical protein
LSGFFGGRLAVFTPTGGGSYTTSTVTVGR